LVNWNCACPLFWKVTKARLNSLVEQVGTMVGVAFVSVWSGVGGDRLNGRVQDVLVTGGVAPVVRLKESDVPLKSFGDRFCDRGFPAVDPKLI